jgi:hypothetical protein
MSFLLVLIYINLYVGSFSWPGASEQAQRQLYRALRYHNLLDPQLHNTLRDLLTAIKGPEKGLKTAARIYLSRSEYVCGPEGV